MRKFWEQLTKFINRSTPPFFSIGGVLLLYLLLTLCTVVITSIHEVVWPASFEKYWYYDSTLSFLFAASIVFYLRPGLIALSRWRPRWSDCAVGIPLGILVPTILWLAIRNPVDTLRLHPLPLASILPIVCLGPIVEEIVFRGTVLRSFKSYLPLTVAILLATFLVSLIHPHFWAAMPIQLTLSVLYVAMCDSMPASIVAHIANNAFVFALTTGAAEKWHAYFWSVWK